MRRQQSDRRYWRQLLEVRCARRRKIFLWRARQPGLSQVGTHTTSNWRTKQGDFLQEVVHSAGCAKPARDAALSPWMYPPASLNDWPTFAYRSSAHVYTSQVHISFTNNGTPSANASPRVETCCCHQLTRSKYLWTFHHRPKVHEPAHLQTCRLPPVGGHLCC